MTSFPKINIIFDHPLYITYYLLMPIKTIIYAHKMRDMQKYIKEYYQNINDAWHFATRWNAAKKEHNNLKRTQMGYNIYSCVLQLQRGRCCYPNDGKK